MTAVLVRVHVMLVAFGQGLRRHWKRIAIGAFCGWVASTVLGAFALAWLESQHVLSPDGTTPVVAAALVWAGIALGAVLAYAVRPERNAEPVRATRSRRGQ